MLAFACLRRICFWFCFYCHFSEKWQKWILPFSLRHTLYLKRRFQCLTNFIHGPEASTGHRAVRLETDPESISGGQYWCWQGGATVLPNEWVGLTRPVSNLKEIWLSNATEMVMLKDQKCYLLLLSSTLITQIIPQHNQKDSHYESPGPCGWS